MNIVPYESAMIEQVTAIYNATISGVPYCRPVHSDMMSQVLHEKDDASGEGLRCQKILAALDGIRLKGFIHFGVAPCSREMPEMAGWIRFFTYLRGERSAGQSLLDAAEEVLQGQQIDRIVAFPNRHRYWFHHLMNAYLSDHMGPVASLLGNNGYERRHGEVFMEWRNLGRIETDRPPVDVLLEEKYIQGRGALPGLELRGTIGGRQAGACVCLSAAEFLESEDSLFVKWLGVEREFQGRGVGRFLLQSALSRLVANGYRHALISTAWTNFRAAVFYTNIGFQVTDWTYGLEKRVGAIQ